MSMEERNEYLFVFSQEWPGLAFAEVQACNPEGKEWHYKNKYAYVLLSKPFYKHLALTKQTYLIYAKGDLKEVEVYAKEKAILVDEPVSFQKICLSKDKTASSCIESSEARRILNSFTSQPIIKLKEAKRKFVLLQDKDLFFIAEELWENKEQFAKRRNHLLPAPHPTSLQPKLARALINLASPKRTFVLLDPFCGSGGILIEAALMQYECKGIDIDQDMLKRAKRNLVSLGLSTTLSLGDARESLYSVDAIVTDLPYGKNSKADNLEELYACFLKNAEQFTKKMVVAAPSSARLSECIKQTHWKIKRSFSLPLHKSLTKEVFILEG